jgi:hypothetical protein
MSWVRKAICQLVIPVFQGGGADHDDEDDSVGSNLIAIIKLVNKVSYNGDKSAAIRQARRDCGPSLRCAHHLLITEALTDDYGTDNKGGERGYCLDTRSLTTPNRPHHTCLPPYRAFPKRRMRRVCHGCV